MNNIEIEQLKRDILKYIDNPDLIIKVLASMNERQILKLKKEINDMRNKKKSRVRGIDRFDRLKLQMPGNGLVAPVQKKISTSRSVASDSTIPKKAEDSGVIKAAKQDAPTKQKKRTVSVPANRKPKILLIADVKDWAWWLKGEFLQEHLSDEFDIDLICTIGPGCTSQWDIQKQKNYDFYFTFGYSYIDFLHAIPKAKKATGVTAHRPPRMLKPKMDQAGHLHANSIMLRNQLNSMGYAKVHYIPNGVDETLFRPVKPIPLHRDKIICGHVGKECIAKGQKEIIYPAIKKADGQKVSSVVTWKEKIPHKEMYKIYQEMDVFLIASTEDGTPNPGLEAAACGRPIISNRIGNMPELIKNGVNGFIVKRDIESYVDKIKWLQDNRDKMITMGQKAREAIEKYWTWKIQAENYRKMFREIFVKGG